MDYALPRAEMLTSYETDRTETPTPVNPLGGRGRETGTIVSTPAVVNAVVDALAGMGVDHIEAMPLTSERLEDHPGRQSQEVRGRRMYPAQFDYHTPGTVRRRSPPGAAQGRRRSLAEAIACCPR
jgi:hypothetical protein